MKIKKKKINHKKSMRLWLASVACHKCFKGKKVKK